MGQLAQPTLCPCFPTFFYALQMLQKSGKIEMIGSIVTKNVNAP